MAGTRQPSARAGSGFVGRIGTSESLGAGGGGVWGRHFVPPSPEHSSWRSRPCTATQGRRKRIFPTGAGATEPSDTDLFRSRCSVMTNSSVSGLTGNHLVANIQHGRGRRVPCAGGRKSPAVAGPAAWQERPDIG